MVTKSQSKRRPRQSAVNEENAIVIDRVFNLPLNKVWKAWTEPEGFKKWWGPEGYTCPFSEVDFSLGGKYLHCMRSPNGEEFWSTGVYQEITPYKKLVITDSFSDEEGNVIPASEYNMPGEWPTELLVTVTFKEEGEKTRITLRHEGIPDEMRDECISGWNQSLDKMERNSK